MLRESGATTIISVAPEPGWIIHFNGVNWTTIKRSPAKREVPVSATGASAVYVKTTVSSPCERRSIRDHVPASFDRPEQALLRRINGVAALHTSSSAVGAAQSSSTSTEMTLGYPIVSSRGVGKGQCNVLVTHCDEFRTLLQHHRNPLLAPPTSTVRPDRSARFIRATVAFTGTGTTIRSNDKLYVVL